MQQQPVTVVVAVTFAPLTVSSATTLARDHVSMSEYAYGTVLGHANAIRRPSVAVTRIALALAS